MDPSNGISILQGHRWIITVALALNICCDVYGLHTVITQPDATKTINITQTDLGIICTMRGSTAVVFSWNWRQPQNGQHEPAYYFEQFGGSNQAGASIVDSSYSLQWRSNVSLDDRKQASGTLYAYVTHDGQTTETDYMVLNLQWPPESASVSPYGSIKSKRGESLTLTCSTVDPGNPPGSVVWTKGNDIKTTNSTGHNSIILNPISVDHGGDWKCYYDNYLGEGDPSQDATITVVWPASNVMLTVSNTVELNHSLEMNCSREEDGNPSSNVKFTLNGVTYSGNIELKQGSTFTYRIEGVTKSDNGLWECCYNNTAGSVCSQARETVVQWNVSTDGEIKLKAANQDVREGDDVTLEYELTDKGSPGARVTWTHNDTAKSGESNYTLKLEDVKFSDSGVYSCYANNSFSKSDDAVFTLKVEPRQEMQIWVYIVIGVCCGIIIIVIIVIVICVVKKKKGKDKKSDSIGYTNRSLQPDNMTGTGPANKPNVEGYTTANSPRRLPKIDKSAAAPVYAAVSRGKVLAPIAAGADGSVYSHVDLSKKTARQSLKGLPMSKKAIDRIIFHKKDGYVNMTFQVRKKFIGDIEIGVCRIGDQSCTSKVSKQHDGASKDVVMVLPIEDSSPDSYSIRIKFTERGQVTQTVDLTYPYNKNAVNVTVLNEVHSTNGSEMPENSEVNKPKTKKKAAEDQTYEDVERDSQSSRNDRPTNVVSPSYADVEVEGVPPRPSRQGYPAEGVTYAVMDWDRSQAPGRPPRLSSRSPAQEHVVYADVRPGGNVN